MAVHTEVSGPAHPYTRSEIPWIMDANAPSSGRLVRYISAGGMRTFGRTIRQEEARRRQRRFCIEVAVAAAIWLALLVF